MYNKGKRSWLKHLDFTLIDIASIEIAFIIAYGWRFGGAWVFVDPIFRPITGLTVLFAIVIVLFTEPYSGILRRNKYQEFKATFIHFGIIFAMLLVYLYALQASFYYSRIVLFAFFIGAFCIAYVARCVRKRMIRKRKLSDIDKNSMIAIVEEKTAERCIKDIAHNGYLDFKVGGVIVVDKDMVGQEIQGIPVVATADSCFDYLKGSIVDEIFIDGNTRESSELLANTLVELGYTVHVSLVNAELLTINRMLETYGTHVCLTSSMHIASGGQLVLKRIMDIVGSIVGLIITGIAFIIIAPIIKCQSPGPIFYKSTRIGRGGRRFTFYKFRTMVVNADNQKEELMADNEMEGNIFKIEDDPRIIPVGHFLRKHSIDELPQFLNVLKGEMSLVGTRPPTEEEFENYEAHHRARLGIKPGLSGLWQVSGRSDITDFEEIVKMDTEYIANWSPWFDIKIIFKTIKVVFTGEGSK